MANADQLSKQLLESMEIIGKSITNGLEFDKTIKAVVQSSSGTNYSCKSNDIIFTAVGPEGEYIEGDNVWVNIPQNDWKNQKTIISRSETDENPNRVILPFTNLISVNNDRPFYESSSEYSILANGSDQEVLIDSISSLYTNYNEPYDLIGIKVSFNTGKLTPFNVVEGNYGIRLKLKNSENVYTAIYEFDCSNMMGNLYAFNDWIEQQYVFDISELGNLIQPTDILEIYLIQKSDFAGYHTSSTQKEYLIYQEGDDTSDNIEARSIKLFLGYNRNNIVVDEGNLSLVDGDYLYYEGWAESGRNNKKFVSSIWKLDEGGTLYRENNIESLVWSFGNDKSWEVIPTASKKIVDGVAIVVLPVDRLKEDNIYFRCGKSVVTLSRFKAPMYSIEYDMEHAIRLSYSYDKEEEQDGVHYYGPESRLSTLSEAFAPHFIDLNWEPLSAEIVNDPTFLSGATITWETPGFLYATAASEYPTHVTNMETVFMPPVNGREYCDEYDTYDKMYRDKTRISYTFGANFDYTNDCSLYKSIARTKGAFNSTEDLALKVRDVNHCMFKFRVKHQYLSTMTNNTVTCIIKKGVYTFKGSFTLPVFVERKGHAQVLATREDFEPLYITNKNGLNTLKIKGWLDNYSGEVKELDLGSGNFELMRQGNNCGYMNTRLINENNYSPFSRAGYLQISSIDTPAFTYNSNQYTWAPNGKYYRYIFGVSGSSNNTYKIFYFDFAERVTDPEAVSITVGNIAFKYVCDTINIQGGVSWPHYYSLVMYDSQTAGQNDNYYFSEVMTIFENVGPNNGYCAYPAVVNNYTQVSLTFENSKTAVISLDFSSAYGSPIDDNVAFLGFKISTSISSRQTVQHIPIVYRLKCSWETAENWSYTKDTEYLIMVDGPNKFYMNAEGQVVANGQTDENGLIGYGWYGRAVPFSKKSFNISNWGGGPFASGLTISSDNPIYRKNAIVVLKAQTVKVFDRAQLATNFYLTGLTFDYIHNPGAAKEYSEFSINSAGDYKHYGWYARESFISPEYMSPWTSNNKLYPSIGAEVTVGAAYYDWRSTTVEQIETARLYTVVVVQYVNNWSDDFNQWDGNSVKIGDTSVFARSMAAGTKSRGLFTGIVMGDISNVDGNTRQHGLYGYQDDQPSFGLMASGKAFFGKNGSGRIEIDGTNSTITSKGYQLDHRGLFMDLDNPKLYLENMQTVEGEDVNYYLKLDVTNHNLSPNDYPLKIGYGDSPKFKVNWKGELSCTDVVISGARITDIVQATVAQNGSVVNNGTISGGTIENVTITGDDTDLNLANLRIRRTGVEFSSGYMDVNAGCSFRFHSTDMDKYQINFVSDINSDGTYTVGTMFVIGSEPAYNTHVLPFPYLESISQTTTTGSPLATVTDNNGNSTTIYRGTVTTDFTECPKYNNH